MAWSAAAAVVAAALWLGIALGTTSGSAVLQGHAIVLPANDHRHVTLNYGFKSWAIADLSYGQFQNYTSVNLTVVSVRPVFTNKRLKFLGTFFLSLCSRWVNTPIEIEFPPKWINSVFPPSVTAPSRPQLVVPNAIADGPHDPRRNMRCIADPQYQWMVRVHGLPGVYHVDGFEVVYRSHGATYREFLPQIAYILRFARPEVGVRPLT
jgi:hypothetical protein